MCHKITTSISLHWKKKFFIQTDGMTLKYKPKQSDLEYLCQFFTSVIMQTFITLFKSQQLWPTYYSSSDSLKIHKLSHTNSPLIPEQCQASQTVICRRQCAAVACPHRLPCPQGNKSYLQKHKVYQKTGSRRQLAPETTQVLHSNEVIRGYIARQL